MKTIEFKIGSEHGLHARPAGQIVNMAKGFDSEITVTKGDKSASAKALFALMGLNIKFGDAISFTIDGADEELAVEAMNNCLKEFSNI